MESAENYRSFYDRLGREYEETATVYSTRRGQVRYRAVLRELRSFAIRHLSLLDVGCNDGVYAIPYCRYGGVAHGIDISGALVEKARSHNVGAGTRATFSVADIEEFVPEPNFDLVLMSEVLEHVRNPSVAVRNAVAGIRPGGHLLLTTPLPSLGFVSYLRDLVARRPRTQPEEFEFFGLRYRHDGYYPLALKDWLESFGLICEKAITIEREIIQDAHAIRTWRREPSTSSQTLALGRLRSR